MRFDDEFTLPGGMRGAERQDRDPPVFARLLSEPAASVKLQAGNGSVSAFVIIDHTSFPGRAAGAGGVSAGYAPQLMTYA